VEALVARGAPVEGTLADAARSGNAALVGWLLAHGVDAKEDDDLTVPPLLLADEHDAVVDLLLARGAREPSLARAVAAAAPRAVARLLRKGASAGSRSADGEPVLLLALRDAGGSKRRLIVEALLAAGADVNTRFDDDTPLALALAAATARASSDDERPEDRAVAMVGRLVARGARVDGSALVHAMSADPAGRPALLDALLAGSLTRGATLEAVAHAAEVHDVASLARVAQKGVAWSASPPQATPPLLLAIASSDVAIVNALLGAGAPMEAMGQDGDGALLAAVAAAAGESDDALRVVRLLLERGANPNRRGREGRTALFAAAQQGSEALVTLLVAKGARVDDPVGGMTPREVADLRGHAGVVELLEARGARRSTRRSLVDAY
jgi:ankyrin repeat protein